MIGLNEFPRFINELPEHTVSSVKGIFAEIAMSVQKQMAQRSINGRFTQKQRTGQIMAVQFKLLRPLRLS